MSSAGALKSAAPTSAAKVAIIGAGLAGVTCALGLEQLGAQVTLFEKSRAVSGRMSTRRGQLSRSDPANAGDVPWQYDHGAQYFLATDAAFQAQVLRWQALGIAQLWQPRIAALSRFGQPQSLAAVQMPSGEIIEDREQAMAITRWVGTPRMSSIVPELAKALVGSVMLETTVNALTRSIDGWRLGTLEHGQVDPSFDTVILALPAPQAAALLQTGLAGCARLGELAEITASQPMQACWSVMLHLSQPLKLDFDAATIDAGPLRWVARDNTKPGRPALETWVLHASAQWSAAHIEASAEWVQAELIGAFCSLTHSTLTPLRATAHRWRYATALARSVGQSGAAASPACYWQRELGLGLCGDWLAGSTVQAAWLSAARLAQLMVADLLGAAATDSSATS